MAEDRPNPEDLLEIVQREESQQRKGKLKIFLGMAAGVGKTYAMLMAAQQLKKEGVNVIAGVIDTHGRRETAELLKGLELIPEKMVEYKNSTFAEMDLDAIIKRKPEVVLVDELAHSNVTGSRHPKRWQDVMEILDNGIDVYTTLNVQHIESRTDVIESIAGITIRETVPDLVIDRAASIELIDITPDELLRRLKEGKVYIGNQSIIAAQNFFQADRLTALREIVLRYAAEKVDHDLHGMFSSVERADVWKPRERLLVAVSPHPISQKIIRITRRLAFNLNAPWIALHVDDGSVLTNNEQKALAINLALARDLGAEVITISGIDRAQAIQRVARQKSVTQIIIGRSHDHYQWVRSFFKPNLVDRLAMECSDIDLHVIRTPLLQKPSGSGWTWLHLPKNLWPYIVVLLFVLSLTAVDDYFLDIIGYKIAGITFLLGILSLSLYFKKGPIFFAAILYALIWFFVFIPPEELFTTRIEDLILLTCYVLTAIITGILTDRAKRNHEMLMKREKSITAMYDIVKEIASSPSFDLVLMAVKNKLSNVLGGKCEIIIKKLDEGLLFDESNLVFHEEKEKNTAIWVFKNGKEAGWSTSTLPSSQYLYIPLKGARETVGVLAYRSKTDTEPNIEEHNFLYTVGQQLANYLERTFAEEKARKLEHHHQVERIYQSILNLISNLFEGPLLIIQDAIKEIKTEIPQFTDKSKNSLEVITTASTNLSRILENISAMVNLSAGLTPVKREKYQVRPLINTCCERIKKMKYPFNWSVKIEPNLPEIMFDYNLIELVFYNLAFHAMEFALPDSTIEIKASRQLEMIDISITSEGQSIPPEMLDVAYEGFYRLQDVSSSGLGFGIAIAKTIAEIHHGQLKVQNIPKGGMLFSLLLPTE